MVRCAAIVSVLIVSLMLPLAAHADMIDPGRPKDPPASILPSPTNPSVQEADTSDGLLDILPARLSTHPLATWPAITADTTTISDSPDSLHTLSDKCSSMDFCLYALLGFGLCKSAPWVKKLHFGVVPDWYHSGAPAQIGHSLAIEPNCLCLVAACFVQPDCSVKDFIPQRYLRFVASLWRTSQCTRSILASRAPPLA